MRSGANGSNRTRNIFHKTIASAAAIAAVALSAQSASAQYFWDGGAGADHSWSNPLNWSVSSGGVYTNDVGPPTGLNATTDFALLNNGGTIDINTSDATVGRFQAGRINYTPPGGANPNNANLGGTINIVPGGILADGAAFDLGFNVSNTPPNSITSTITLNVTGGSLFGGNRLSIANNVNNIATTNIGSGLIDLVDLMYVGNNGVGTLNVNGGRIHTGQRISIADGAFGTGTFNFVAGTVDDDKDFVIGNVATASGLSNALMNHTGGTLTVGERYTLGFNTGARGTSVQTGGTVQAGQFDIGRFGNGEMTLKGTAVFNSNSVTALGKLLAGGATVAPSGVLNVQDSASLSTGGMIVGQQGTGTLNLSSGTITVRGSTMGPGTGFPSPDDVYNAELLNLLVGRDGGGNATGTGTINQTGGTMNVATNVVLGDFDDSNGVYNISGGTLAVGGNFNVGAALASNAPTTPVGDGGQALNAQGTLRVQGTGGTITVAGKFVANPGDRVRAGAANRATLAFDISTGVSQVSVGGVADLDGAVIDVGFLSSSTFVPAFNQAFNLLTAASFGATGTGSTQNTGTGQGFILNASDAGEWLLRVIAGGNGQILQAVNRILPGDTNSDLKVNFADLVTLAQNYSETSGNTRAEGDFNRDGATNFADLVVLAQNYNADFTGSLSFASAQFTADWALAQSLVPEPTTLLLAAVAPVAMSRRRRATR